MKNMYQFLLNMWTFGVATEQQINSYVSKGFITRKEGDQILATPRDN